MQQALTALWRFCRTNYIRIKETGITADTSSFTQDRLRGDAPTKGFEWVDRFNQKHFVQVNPNKPQVTMMFPVSNRTILFRARNINDPGDELRTGCGTPHRWCEATFVYQKSGPLPWEGEHVWGSFTFYDDNAIASKCTDWDKWDRAIKTARDGVGLVQSIKSVAGY